MNDKLMNRAIFWTAIWVVLVVAMALFNFVTDYPKKTGLNELGDFVAGAMSPLAIFWLVLVYLQQRKEMREQVEHTEEIALQTQNQVNKMEEQFNKQFEPFFVCVEVGTNEVTNSEMEGYILLENIGGTATEFEAESSAYNEIKFSFETFDYKDIVGGTRKVNFRDAVYVGKKQQFFLNIYIPFENDREKYSKYSLFIYYKDMLGRQFQQPANYQISGNVPTEETFYGTEKTIFNKRMVFDGKAIQIAPLL